MQIKRANKNLHSKAPKPKMNTNTLSPNKNKELIGMSPLLFQASVNDLVPTVDHNSTYDEKLTIVNSNKSKNVKTQNKQAKANLCFKVIMNTSTHVSNNNQELATTTSLFQTSFNNPVPIVAHNSKHDPELTSMFLLPQSTSTLENHQVQNNLQSAAIPKRPYHSSQSQTVMQKPSCVRTPTTHLAKNIRSLPLNEVTSAASIQVAHISSESNASKKDIEDLKDMVSKSMDSNRAAFKEILSEFFKIKNFLMQQTPIKDNLQEFPIRSIPEFEKIEKCLESDIFRKNLVIMVLNILKWSLSTT